MLPYFCISMPYNIKDVIITSTQENFTMNSQDRILFQDHCYVAVGNSLDYNIVSICHLELWCLLLVIVLSFDCFRFSAFIMPSFSFILLEWMVSQIQKLINLSVSRSNFESSKKFEEPIEICLKDAKKLFQQWKEYLQIVTEEY